jgi:hypothetical protein
MRKEKWAQHVCMRLLIVDSNMEEFAWREIYPFTDSLEITFQLYSRFGCKSDPSLWGTELQIIITNPSNHTNTQLHVTTNSTQQRPSSKANKSVDRYKILHILGNPKFHYRLNNSLPPVPILKHISPCPPHHTSWRSILILSSSYTCYIHRPSRSWFDHLNNIWWELQIIKLIVM